MLKSPFSYLNQLVRRVGLNTLFIPILSSSIIHADPNTVALDTNVLQGTYIGVVENSFVRMVVNKRGFFTMTHTSGSTTRGVGEVDSNGKVWHRLSSNPYRNHIYGTRLGLAEIVYQDGLFKIYGYQDSNYSIIDTYTLSKVSYDKNNPVPEHLLTKPGYSQSGLGYYTFGVEKKQLEWALPHLHGYESRGGCGYLKLRPDGRVTGAINYGIENRSNETISGSITNGNKLPFLSQGPSLLLPGLSGRVTDGTCGEIEFDDFKWDSDITGWLDGGNLLLKGSLINLNSDLIGALGFGVSPNGNYALEIYSDLGNGGMFGIYSYSTIKSTLSATVNNNSISVLDSLNLWSLRYLPTTGFINGYVRSRGAKIPKSRIFGVVNTKSGVMFGTVRQNLVPDAHNIGGKIPGIDGPIPTGSVLIIRQSQF